MPKVADKLKEGSVLDPRTAGVLNVATEALARIGRVADDLLEMSSPDAERLRPWDPMEGIDATVRLLQARANPMASIEVRPGPGASVHARPREINQVVMNLIDNAQRAAGPQGSVVVSTTVAEGCYVIEVSDDGPGIPPEVRPRVFEPFFTTRAGGEGFGLGLAIVKRIVDEHLGTVFVGDAVPRGSVFTVRLPLSQETPRASAPTGP